jgi:hypothetical protein
LPVERATGSNICNLLLLPPSFYDDHLLQMTSARFYVASGRTLLTAETMKQMERGLPASQFLRVTKSYLVNMAWVDRLCGNALLVGGRELPVGSTFRMEALCRLQGR